MTSPAQGWLVSFKSTPLDVPACQGLRSYWNGDINFYVNVYMNTFEKARAHCLNHG